MGSHEGQGSVKSGSKRSRLKWAAAAVVLVFMAATGGLFIVSSNIGDWTKRQVIATARQQGLVLELNDVDVSLTNIHFRDARAVLEGVAGVTLYLQSVDIALHGWKPVGSPSISFPTLTGWNPSTSFSGRTVAYTTADRI